MATSRWEGNVHFWDYVPERPELYPEMDAYRTGDAFIYNDKGFANGIVTILTGHEELNGVTLAQAIQGAKAFLTDMTRPGAGSPQEEERR